MVVVNFESLEEVRDILKPQDTKFIRTLGAEPVMPYPENQRRRVKDLLILTRGLGFMDPKGLGSSTS